MKVEFNYTAEQINPQDMKYFSKQILLFFFSD